MANYTKRDQRARDTIYGLKKFEREMQQRHDETRLHPSLIPISWQNRLTFAQAPAGDSKWLWLRCPNCTHSVAMPLALGHSLGVAEAAADALRQRALLPLLEFGRYAVHAILDDLA